MGTSQGEPSQKSKWWQPQYLLPAAGMLIAAVLMIWKTPTHIEMDLTVSQATFTVAPGALETRQSVSLLGGLPFQLIAIQNFEALELRPRDIKRADPSRYDEDAGCVRDTPQAWMEMAGMTALTINRVSGETSQVTFGWKGMSGCESTGVSPTGVLNLSQSVEVSPGAQVKMELQGEDARVLALTITGDRPRLFVTVPPVADMIVDGGQLGNQPPGGDPSKTSQIYRLESSEENRLVEVRAGAEPLIVSLILPSDPGTSGVSRKDIPVSQVEVMRFEGGEWSSNLVAEGSLTYPTDSEIAARRIHEDDVVILNELDGFFLRSLRIDAQRKGLHMQLVGTAGGIRTGPPGSTEDRRLSMFEQWFPVIQRLKDVVGI